MAERVAHYRILGTADADAWRACVAETGRGELVHDPRYARAFERYGDGVAECFVFRERGQLVVYPFMRRPIDGAPGRSDVVTPYGYGGWIHSPGGGRALVEHFRAAFESYACATGIVSEFVRFHPCSGNHEHAEGLLDAVVPHCRNALVDLSRGLDAARAAYRKSYGQCIRRARGAGLSVHAAEDASFIDEFFALYTASMARKRQEGYLRFRREFLVYLAEELHGRLLSLSVRGRGETIASALFLRDAGYMDYFLAASEPAALPLHPNHLLLDEAVGWAHAHGVRCLHLGGGHASLQFFKHGFANGARTFFLGRHVHDRAVYERLAKERRSRMGLAEGIELDFFPAYRAGPARGPG